MRCNANHRHFLQLIGNHKQRKREIGPATTRALVFIGHWNL